MRRAAAVVVCGLALGLGSAASAVAAAPSRGAPPRVVTLIAKRFAYDPPVVSVRVGEPVVLEVTALDHDHGFALPAFGLRADLKRGKVTRIAFVPDRVGVFAFHCDVFCGSGHEDMVGTLQVTE